MAIPEKSIKTIGPIIWSEQVSVFIFGLEKVLKYTCYTALQKPWVMPCYVDM